MSRIFITGSSDGLGLMAAQLLLQQGHSVVLHARNVQRAEATHRRLPWGRSHRHGRPRQPATDGVRRGWSDRSQEDLGESEPNCADVHVIRAFGTLRLPHPDRSNKQTGPSFPKRRFSGSSWITSESVVIQSNAESDRLTFHSQSTCISAGGQTVIGLLFGLSRGASPSAHQTENQPTYDSL